MTSSGRIATIANQKGLGIELAPHLSRAIDREASQRGRLLCEVWRSTETAESAGRRAAVIENRGKSYRRQVVETMIVTIGLAVAIAVAAYFSPHRGC